MCRPLLITLMAALALTAPAEAEDIADDFTAGAGRFWILESNQPLFVFDDSAGNASMSKPTGGTGSGVEFIRLRLAYWLIGDFDIQVSYSSVSLDLISGVIGNQVQLNLVAGDQRIVAVRSDEAGVGHNLHTFIDPPGQWSGTVLLGPSMGTLRIVRAGNVIEVRADGNVLYQAVHNADPVTSLALELQNNQSTDAISVAFDDFAATADALWIFADDFED